MLYFFKNVTNKSINKIIILLFCIILSIIIGNIYISLIFPSKTEIETFITNSNNKIFITDYKGDNYEVSSDYSLLEWNNIKQGQKIMTNMFKEFDTICRQYGLKYWAMGGTLIGAIRHNGWVPWDGDIDLVMEESDLDKFHKVASKHLSSDYFLVNSRIGINKGNFQGGDIGIDKIRYKYGRYSDWDPHTRHHGLQIDLFCIRSNKNNEWEKKRIGNVDLYLNSNAKSIIFPLKEHMFEGFSIMIPNNIKQYCKLWLNEEYPSLLPLHKRKPHEGKIVFDVPKIWSQKMYPNLYN